ncbi:MAG: polysaccharide biosynthesis tyrosine autokinase [Caldilineaceae bacterium]|nr:polysaccharide biosynthesis tyrosine autokinase [Caldilineaceae bacterium]
MEIQTYLAIFWRRKWVIISTALLSLITVAALAYLTTPVYVSSTTLRVATVGANTLSTGRPDIEYTLRLMNTYANIVNSRNTRAELVERLDLDERPALTVSIIPGTELMRIEAEATDPVVARDLAAAAAEIVIRQSQEQFRGGGQSTQEILARQIAQIERELEQARTDYDTLLEQQPENTGAISAATQSIQLKERTYASLLEQYESARIQEALRANSVFIVDAAETPSQPSKPRTELYLALGLIVGLVLGIGLAFLLDSFDSTLHTPGQIEAVTRLPTVGRIPLVHGRAAIIDVNGTTNGYQAHMEAFRRLRVNLLSSVDSEPPQSIMVTSADAGEGKSTITANLALAMAKSGRSVVVLDCDLHKPTLHNVFKLSNEFGLTSVLTKQVSVSGVVQKSAIPYVSVITSGPALLNPGKSPELLHITPSSLVGRLEQGTELLGTREMAQLIEQLKTQYDVILLDTPALLSVTDAAVLAPLVDSVVLVVATERSQRDAVRAMLELLDSVKVKSIGVVINRESQKAKRYAYHQN